MNQRFFLFRSACLMIVVVIGMMLVGFEIYVFAVQPPQEIALPPLFGNSPEIRDILEKTPKKNEFAFAVIGDTLGLGTFESICEQLRNMHLDFAVLLGDCAYKGTKSHHRHFQAELAEELALPFPVLYVAGNHDVSGHDYPVSRFEQVYGPSVFSFTFQDCLFVVLRILDPPFNNAESIAFLEQLKKRHPEKWARRFVFMHIPPPISESFVARRYSEWKDLVRLLEELNIDTVFSGDFHGYARVERNGINYIVTGGGGSPLDNDKTAIEQFHHAVIVTVHPDHISEQLMCVPGNFDIEDYLEKVAIANVYPWMKGHMVFVSLLNLLVLAALIVTLRYWMTSTPRKTSSGS